MKLVLELYAQELRDDAGNVGSVSGLESERSELYKRKCYEAASHLDSAAAILREGITINEPRFIPSQEYDVKIALGVIFKTAAACLVTVACMDLAVYCSPQLEGWLRYLFTF